MPTMAPALARHRYKRVLIEVHPQYADRYQCDIATILAPLRDAGYRAWAVKELPDPENFAESLANPPSISELLDPIDLQKLEKTRHQLWLAPGVTLDS